MVIKHIKIFRICPIAFKSSLKKNIIVFLLAIFSLPIMTATADVSSLGKIFGAFIYRISQFVTWPESAFNGSDDPFRICIYCKDELNISEILEEEIGKTIIHGRKIIVVSLPTMQSAIEYFDSGKKCHVLFISGDSSIFVVRLTALFKEDMTLVMGDSMEFLEAGGMLSLVQREGKLRLFVNGEKVKQSSLKFDSRLMLLVRVK